MFGPCLRLGLTAFGGPVAHLGYFRREFVERRGWLTEGTFAETVALCQFLPGPTSSQVCYLIGLGRGGLLGAWAAWLGFTLPSAIVMTAAGLSLRHAPWTPSPGLLRGLGTVAVAVVAQAVWSMATALLRTWPRRVWALVAAALALGVDRPFAPALALTAGFLAGCVAFPGTSPPPEGDVARLPTAAASRVCLGLFLTGLSVLPLFAAGRNDGWLATFDAFFRVGALVFGGGHVVLPLLQAEVVPRGWVNDHVFLAGYGLAQALPGPLFTFAAYLGAAKAGAPHGAAGGVWALLALVSPSLLLATGVLPWWERLRRWPLARGGLTGANAAVVGILFAAWCRPVCTSALVSPSAAGLAAALFVLLHFGRVPAPAVALAGAALGAGLLN